MEHIFIARISDGAVEIFKIEPNEEQRSALLEPVYKSGSHLVGGAKIIHINRPAATTTENILTYVINFKAWQA